MARPLKLVVGVAALLVVLVAGLYGYRQLKLYDGRTPEGYALLTAMPNAASFEPRVLPASPVLEIAASDPLDIDFGYRVGGISYSYSLALAFPPDADEGKATLTARHSNRVDTKEAPTTRLWDAPRDAYSVALQKTFDIDPAVPSLCIKAVIGPSKTRYDLGAASLCVAQRDGKGFCHPETLACGLIRQRS